MMKDKVEIIRRKSRQVVEVVNPRKMRIEPAETVETSNSRKVRLEPSEYDRAVAMERAAQRSEPPKPTGVVPPRKNYKIIEGIDPVELFMAYHLGVTADDNYKPQNIHDLARRFRTQPGRINEALKAYEIDSETVMNTDFDMAMAQIDIRVAPQGISKRELGRQLYEEFRSSPRITRNWAEELRREAEENRKIFDKLK